MPQLGHLLSIQPRLGLGHRELHGAAIHAPGVGGGRVASSPNFCHGRPGCDGSEYVDPLYAHAGKAAEADESRVYVGYGRDEVYDLRACGQYWNICCRC